MDAAGRRCFDIAVALSALVVLAPVLALIALAIAVTSGRPVLFTQERVGRNGWPFNIHKFRTLRHDAEPAPVTPAHDIRVTPIGRFLRPSKLDELPQFYDVLRGAMSLVGPRPELPENLAAIPSDDRARLLAHRPGLTGPASLAFLAEDQVLDEVADPVLVYRELLLPAKVALDLEALRQRTLRQDLATLLATAASLLSRRRYRESLARVRACLAQRAP